MRSLPALQDTEDDVKPAEHRARHVERASKARAERSIEWVERVDLALTHLRLLLRSKRVTQTALAEELGVNVSSVSFWVAGRWRPDGSRLEALEAALARRGVRAGRGGARRKPEEKERIMRALRTAVACGGSDQVVAGLARLLVGRSSARRRRKTA